MTIRQSAAARALFLLSAVLLALAAAGCAPVFHGGDVAGFKPIYPVGAPPSPSSSPALADR